MSQTKYTYQNTRATITAAGLNSLFENMENMTDGTDGRIDDENCRTEAFNRNHFQQDEGPNKADDFVSADEVVLGYNGAYTGVFTTFWTWNTNVTVGANEVFRVQFNPLVTLTERQNTASVVVRANSAFYVQLYITVGGSDVAICAPFGYNSIQAGDGNTGTIDSKTLFYERLPLTAIFMPTITTAITAIKAKIYFDDGANFKTTMQFLYGMYVHHKY